MGFERGGAIAYAWIWVCDCFCQGVGENVSIKMIKKGHMPDEQRNSIISHISGFVLQHGYSAVNYPKVITRIEHRADCHLQGRCSGLRQEIKTEFLYRFPRRRRQRWFGLTVEGGVMQYREDGKLSLLVRIRELGD